MKVRIRSRHPSHRQFRGRIDVPFPAVVRFGSTTAMGPKFTYLNSPEAVNNSASKLRMKRCFRKAGVKTAVWTESAAEARKLQFPIVAKSYFGSRGRGNYLLNDVKDLDRFISSHGASNYIFEQYYSYVREYRLHVTKNGCFYTCRKMIKEETPKEKRWFRNDSNCVWIVEENPQFEKPKNWKEIESECVKALQSVGLDFGACDVRVQSGKENNNNPKFVIIEINSAPSMGKITAQRYTQMIPTLLKQKH